MELLHRRFRGTLIGRFLFAAAGLPLLLVGAIPAAAEGLDVPERDTAICGFRSMTVARMLGWSTETHGDTIVFRRFDGGEWRLDASNASCAVPAAAQAAAQPAPVFGFAMGAVAAPTADEVRAGVHVAGSWTPVMVGPAALGLEAHFSYVQTERLWAPLTYGDPVPRPTGGSFFVLGLGTNGSVGKTLGRIRPYVTAGAGAYRITGELLDGPRDSYGYYREYSDGYTVLAVNGGVGLERRLGGRALRSLVAEARYHRGIPAGERDQVLVVSGGVRLSRR